MDGAPLGERNPKWLNDDYVKFIRFAQWRIEQTGYGVLAFVTNHGYLDNPTFRGMRQSLMQSFDDIYLLDLHGNSKKKEKAPDGGKDENVFDIQQGVAIGIFVKRKPTVRLEPLTPVRPELVEGTNGTQDRPVEGHSAHGSTSSPRTECNVRHADLYGTRASKYAGLAENDVATTRWQVLKPQAPFYLFVPQDETLRAEYEQGWKITDIMPVNSVGIVTARDALSIHWSREDIWRAVNDFANLPVAEAREKYALGKDARDWQIALAQADLKASGLAETKLAPVLYRPFDVRHTYYTGNSRGFHCMPRNEVMRQMLAGKNLGLITSRLTKGETFQHAQVTRNIVEVICMSPKTSNNGFVFPLYLYSTTKADLFAQRAGDVRRPNLAPEFIADFSARLQLDFVPDCCGDLKKTFGPEDVFHYAYAVFHSPTYRNRYAEFLKIDFPRLPLTRDAALFRSLCALGKELVVLHLMEQLPKLETRYPVAGDNTVDAVRYTEPSPPAPPPPAGEGSKGRVWINQKQYFDNVPPEVWGYHIGGYQVCQKWLKDRKGRQLSYDDLTHYRGIVAALARTIELQAAIDDAIGEWPLQ
ncbi:MAG: N-6 DNA methylase [Gallionellaceae bacterium]|nr:MAG: N-6 DNA methylase [Gallionellaceae bacterium]